MIALLLSVLLGVALPAGAARPQLPSPDAALPPGTHATARVALPGFAGTYAAAFTSQTSYVGVVRVIAGKATLLWQVRLPGPASLIQAPGPRGLFRGVAHGHRRSSATLFAYRFTGSTVTSAIAGSSSGQVTGNEGVGLARDAFTIRRRDASHEGSVRYRLVTRFSWTGRLYRRSETVRVPDYPPNRLPAPSATVRTSSGDVILIRLEVADTEQQRETGLMNRHSLDRDSGMIFVWPDLTQDDFWMENTYIPLSIAFLSPSGVIQEIQDMEPLTTVHHHAAVAYQYAIEANQGFFAANGIRTGDRFTLDLSR
jgi:uncharacterized membrane protein (UPF0127 family)